MLNDQNVVYTIHASKTTTQQLLLSDKKHMIFLCSILLT